MKKYLIATITTLVFASSASAVALSGQSGSGTPPIPGASSTITFDDLPNEVFGSKTIGGVTFSGVNGDIRRDNAYAGEYNSRGAGYLDNNQGQTNMFRFDFVTPISAFAFNFGASDVVWLLSAYDAANNLIESVAAPITGSDNAGDYIGLQNVGMAYATFAGTGDWVFVDNFTISAQRSVDVPEPATVALLGLGLLGFAASRRKSPKSKAA